MKIESECPEGVPSIDALLAAGADMTDAELLESLREAVAPLGMEPRGIGKADAHCPTWPTDHQVGDYGFLPVMHDAYPFGFDIAGWTRLGTGPSPSGASITSFYRFAMSAHECNPMILVTGVNTFGRIFTFAQLRALAGGGGK